jgi:hypothetical protein
MKRCFLAVFAVLLLLTGCGQVGVTVSQDQADFATMGLELLSFNAGYLVVDKWPDKAPAIAAEVAALEAVLAGNQADAANAAFQLAVQKLLGLTNNDPLVAANVGYLSRKIKFTQTADGKPLIDVPQMKLIVQNFKDGAALRGAVVMK